MSEKLWLIWSNAHGMWWRANRGGYATDINKAGRYVLDEAEKICRAPNYRGNAQYGDWRMPEVISAAPEFFA